MHRLTRMTLLTGCLLLAGCTNIAGRWEASGDTGDFKLARATFNNDKTYEATGVYGGQERTSSGKYAFNGTKLTLTPDSGREVRTYDAMLGMNGKTLNVTDKSAGQAKKAKMNKVGCPKDCTKDCCKKS